MSIDPVEQDTREYHDNLARYNRWYEQVYPVFLQKVRENYTFFEGVVFDYFPDIANEVDDLKSIHKSFISARPEYSELFKKWMDECDEETKRWMEEYDDQ